MSPPLASISGMIPRHQREHIEAIGGDDGISAGLRIVVTAGLAGLQGDAALLEPVERLQELADQLSRIQGRFTPAGAWWAPDPDALPEPEDLDPTGAVMVTPTGVCLVGDGGLVIDLADGLITAGNGNHEVKLSVDLNDIAGPAALLPAAITGLAAAGPGRRELGTELAIQRTEDGLCRLTLRGMGATVTPTAAQTFAAELLGLVARTTRRSAAARVALERQLREEVGT